MEKITITIKMYSEKGIESKEQVAYRASDIFAVHRRTTIQKSEIVISKQWVITHIETGTLFNPCSFETKEAAIDRARNITNMYKAWENIEKEKQILDVIG